MSQSMLTPEQTAIELRKLGYLQTATIVHRMHPPKQRVVNSASDLGAFLTRLHRSSAK